MFNNYSTTTNKTVVSNHINAVSGNITKTYVNSFFLRFHLKSELANRLLSPRPCYKCKRAGDMYEESHLVQVVQMVICGDMEVIAEVIFKEDYEEMLEKLD